MKQRVGSSKELTKLTNPQPDSPRKEERNRKLIKSGSAVDYLTAIYCTNGNRYIKPQSVVVVGNTLTVEFDDDVTSETVVAEFVKKGV